MEAAAMRGAGASVRHEDRTIVRAGPATDTERIVHQYRSAVEEVDFRHGDIETRRVITESPHEGQVKSSTPLFQR
jgi:hypothetical protein